MVRTRRLPQAPTVDAGVLTINQAASGKNVAGRNYENAEISAQAGEQEDFGASTGEIGAAFARADGSAGAASRLSGRVLE